MTTKHTPGPWKMTEGISTFAVKRSGDLGYICTMVDVLISDYKTSEQKANARLIAAAPEMLELLKVLNEEALRNKPVNELLPHIWERTAEIIAKAEGGSK